MPEVSIERLRKIQWRGDNCGCECCPVCDGLNPAYMPPMDYATAVEKAIIEPTYGHSEGCWLGELLRATAFAVKGAG